MKESIWKRPPCKCFVDAKSSWLGYRRDGFKCLDCLSKIQKLLDSMRRK